MRQLVRIIRVASLTLSLVILMWWGLAFLSYRLAGL